MGGIQGVIPRIRDTRTFGKGAALLPITGCLSGAQLGEGTARGPWCQPALLEALGNSQPTVPALPCSREGPDMSTWALSLRPPMMCISVCEEVQHLLPLPALPAAQGGRERCCPRSVSKDRETEQFVHSANAF